MSFSAVVGQDGAKEVLGRTLASGRVAHGYCFLGPSGVGRKLTALAFAQALNCLAEGGRPCGACLACRKIATGNHPDVRVIVPDGLTLKIEQARELAREVSYRPLEGRFKVYVLDDAERMTLPTANALLKTLEEPPPQVVLILICRNPRMLPLTVLSRCQIVRFRPLAEGEFVAALGQRGVATAEARLLARICQGRLGLAMEGEGGQVIEQRNQALDLLRGVREKGAEALFVGVEPMGRDRPRAELILEAWRLWYRDLLWLKAGAPEDGVVNSDCLPELHRQVAVYSMEEILRDMETLREIWQALQSNVSPRLGLEVALMTIGLDRKAA